MKIIKIKTHAHNSWPGDKSKRLDIYFMNSKGKKAIWSPFNIEKTKNGYENDNYNRIFKTIKDAKEFARKMFFKEFSEI